ncbi:SCO3242 family prenyltransferase [Georgenia faecalis]|uniref:SCO3242 family prenyltransferase n=1 Tax=Georgenia faecalis TaxID=2483799 RepID=A0ABV9D6C3_9MICO|nr:UbiA family prenyltransferase [Georgenia faecalis]
MTSARDLAELVRLPAALTVPGDTLAGAAAAGWPGGARTALLPAASACLYWAGMALNDYADRDLDAVERPERPIPSGRVSPRLALGVGVVLTAAGLGLAAAVSRRHLAVAAALASTVWAYDLLAKPTVLGPVVMAANRGLDVALGAAGNVRPALPAALTLTAHTVAVTALSRGEVTGTSPAVARAALATTAVTAAAAALPAPRTAPRTASRTTAALGGAPLSRVAAAGLAATYAWTVGRAQLDAARRPDAPTVRRATGVGIRGMIPLQSALTARAGALPAAAAVLAVGPLARLATRRLSPT